MADNMGRSRTEVWDTPLVVLAHEVPCSRLGGGRVADHLLECGGASGDLARPEACGDHDCDGLGAAGRLLRHVGHMRSAVAWSRGGKQVLLTTRF